MVNRSSRGAKLSRIAKNFGASVLDRVSPRPAPRLILVPVPVQVRLVERRPSSGFNR